MGTGKEKWPSSKILKMAVRQLIAAWDYNPVADFAGPTADSLLAPGGELTQSALGGDTAYAASSTTTLIRFPSARNAASS
jgi:hypothetical protein